ncbi:IS3 family transposase [Streptomyces sp. NPDC003635]
MKRLCEVLGLHRSSYYKWLSGQKARASRQSEDRLLAEQIRQVHAESGGAYGSPRVTTELRAKGLRVNEKRVARLMRAFSITGIRLRRRVRTTVADPAAPQVPDLFQRDFTATEPGRTYMGDITYLPLAPVSSASPPLSSHEEEFSHCGMYPMDVPFAGGAPTNRLGAHSPRHVCQHAVHVHRSHERRGRAPRGPTRGHHPGPAGTRLRRCPRPPVPRRAQAGRAARRHRTRRARHRVGRRGALSRALAARSGYGHRLAAR